MEKSPFRQSITVASLRVTWRERLQRWILPLLMPACLPLVGLGIGLFVGHHGGVQDGFATLEPSLKTLSARLDAAQSRVRFLEDRETMVGSWYVEPAYATYVSCCMHYPDGTMNCGDESKAYGCRRGKLIIPRGASVTFTGPVRMENVNVEGDGDLYAKGSLQVTR